MLQRIFRYIHALLQFYVDIFLLYIDNGFINTFRILFAFLTNQPIIKVNHVAKVSNKTIALFYNAEAYHRITLYHFLHSFKQMSKLIDTIPAHDCRYILDLGANCGHFSVIASERFPQAKIYAFEPSPSLHSILQKNIAHRNIELVAKAVSNEVGVTKFHVNPEGQQTNSILAASVEMFGKNYQTIEVPLTTLDVFAAENRLTHIDIIKIDCQGVESLILKGATTVLQQTDYLVLEITFLDKDIQWLLNYVMQYFPYYKVVNPLMLGADLVFSKKPFKD